MDFQRKEFIWHKKTIILEDNDGQYLNIYILHFFNFLDRVALGFSLPLIMVLTIFVFSKLIILCISGLK
jgi:hypothetical protein